ncbi:nuclear transport factor 2 family protein [Flavobacterium sp. DG1-102-2]|uniref:nuclear transport factor 2 family protein n=1 Tax=Flavobacterium sp. DG1-102-2 TaxID=3081663 RepID=UPI00294A8F13|nr:nuclear transport factor 2 family protein [Flavobacterium sp. DG1-102-2]MDV6169689.1 nuclear transport factor 2 family protein [Flavobacterium sp. DG1-102-2]
MKNEQNAAIIQGLYNAVNERNFEYLNALSSAKSEWLDIPFNITVTGETSVMISWQNRFNMFPDAAFEIKNLIAHDNFVIVQGVEKGTYKGFLESLDEDIIAEGTWVEIGFCDVYYLEEGTIVKANSNFDIDTLIHQISAIPA